MPMQLAYVKRLASAFKDLFKQSVRRSSGPALMHDHAVNLSMATPRQTSCTGCWCFSDETS